jgi:tetratricopeptide repeat protein
MLRLGRIARTRKLIDRADRARDRRNWGAAARLYGKALDRAPINPPIWVQYGHALKESGRLAEAEHAYRTAILCDPGNADAHLQLGHVLKLQSKRAEAEAAYLLSSALDPGAPEPARELGEVGWPDTALIELKRIAAVELAARPASAESASGLASEARSPGAVQCEAELDRLAGIVSETERWAEWSEAAAVHMQGEIADARRVLARVLRRSALMLAGTAR